MICRIHEVVAWR